MLENMCSETKPVGSRSPLFFSQAASGTRILLSVCVCVFSHSCTDLYHLHTTPLSDISAPSPRPSPWSIRCGTGLFMSQQWCCQGG